MKKIIKISLIVILICLVLFAVLWKMGKLGREKLSSLITEEQARVIAEKSCIKGGQAMSAGVYDANKKTWTYEANTNAMRPGCNSYCIVSEKTKKAEGKWICKE